MLSSVQIIFISFKVSNNYQHETTNYLATTQKLEQATESIVRDNEIIASHLKAANMELGKSQPDMDKQPPVLSSVINTLTPRC